MAENIASVDVTYPLTNCITYASSLTEARQNRMGMTTMRTSKSPLQSSFKYSDAQVLNFYNA